LPVQGIALAVVPEEDIGLVVPALVEEGDIGLVVAFVAAPVVGGIGLAVARDIDLVVLAGLVVLDLVVLADLVVPEGDIGLADLADLVVPEGEIDLAALAVVVAPVAVFGTADLVGDTDLVVVVLVVDTGLVELVRVEIGLVVLAGVGIVGGVDLVEEVEVFGLVEEDIDPVVDLDWLIPALVEGQRPVVLRLIGG